jgi:hypothetical protein
MLRAQRGSRMGRRAGVRRGACGRRAGRQCATDISSIVAAASAAVIHPTGWVFRQQQQRLGGFKSECVCTPSTLGRHPNVSADFTTSDGNHSLSFQVPLQSPQTWQETQTHYYGSQYAPQLHQGCAVPAAISGPLQDALMNGPEIEETKSRCGGCARGGNFGGPPAASL